MAAGLAVAGTDIDGIRALVGPQGLRFLAPPGDDQALAAAILRLANDSNLRVTIGAENEQRVREKYNALRMCEETTNILKELLAAR
jgi:glycosyltransferase involved in cell wall biosynthesis